MKSKIYDFLLGLSFTGLAGVFVTLPLLLGTGFEGWNQWYSFWYSSYLFSFTFYMPSALLIIGPVLVCGSIFLSLGSFYFLMPLRNPLAILSTSIFLASSYFNLQWTAYLYTIPNSTTFPDPATWLSWWNMLDYGFLIYSLAFLMLSFVVLSSSMLREKNLKLDLLGGVSICFCAVAVYLQFIDQVPSWQPSSVVRSGSQIHLGLIPLLLASVFLILAFYYIHSEKPADHDE